MGGDIRGRATRIGVVAGALLTVRGRLAGVPVIIAAVVVALVAFLWPTTPVWVSLLTYGIFLVLLVFGAWLLAETRDEEEEALRGEANEEGEKRRRREEFFRDYRGPDDDDR
jgi:membrane protein implicated in regulation of membrane protease activity